jgi:predicted RNase H-like HicB family nuclease
MDREAKVEFEQEEDARWIAEFPVLPGALCYGATKKEMAVKLAALLMRILADRIKHGEEIPALYDEKADELAGLREIAHLFHSPMTRDSYNSPLATFINPPHCELGIARCRARSDLQRA